MIRTILEPSKEWHENLIEIRTFPEEVPMETTCVDEGGLTKDRHLSRESDLAKNPVKTETDKSFSCLSSAEHLREAKNALMDGHKIDTNPIKTVWGRLNDAKRHLKAIDPQASQFAAARGLADEILLRQRQMKDACVNAVHQHMVKQRETLANELEQYFITKGMYVEIELSGSGKTSLRVTSAVFQEASINRIADETGFFSHLKRVGFASIIFENNDGKVRAYRFETQ